MFSTAHGEPGKELQCFQRWGWDGDEWSRHPIPMLPPSPMQWVSAPACPGLTPRCHWAMVLWVATVLLSRATSPAPSMVHPAVHLCSRCAHSHILRPMAATSLQTPIPAPTAAREMLFVPQKHLWTNVLSGKSPIVPGDTQVASPNQKPPQRCLHHPSAWPAANSVPDLPAIAGGRGANHGQRWLTPPVISPNTGWFGDRDQHQLLGPDMATGLLPRTTGCSWSS